MNNIKYLLFDWGDTLMIDYPEYKGAMVTWEKVSPMPEVIQTVPIISKKIRCAVASNAVESNAELMKQAFKRINLDTYFSMFITSKELGTNKPAPAFFERIASKLSLNTSEICMIGNDYDKDIVGAKNAGMKTIFITTQPYEFPCADYVIASFGELLNIFNDTVL